MTKRRNGVGGMSEYKAWQGMKLRCFRRQHIQYPDYGGRGITVCPQWVNSFPSFFKHIGPKPSKDHCLDRIDNDGSYEPGNVKWSTRVESNNNTRGNKKIKYLGVEMKLAEAIRLSKSSVALGTIRQRLNRGWPADEALGVPRLKRWNVHDLSLEHRYT